MIRVLYVDDERAMLDIGKLFIEQMGEFEVKTMISAEEALNSPEILSYDAIISDYQMPNMDGISFLKAIRAKSPDIPFIIFTGRGREEVVIEALNNGADFYLQKGGNPYAQFAELAHKTRRAVEYNRLRSFVKKNTDKSSYEEIIDPSQVQLMHPTVKTFHCGKREKSIVRFCFVQLDYSLRKEMNPFGYFLEESDLLKMKIISSITIAKENKVDLICFPELSFKMEWIDEICKISEKMIVVGGSFYNNAYNVCSLIIDGKQVHPLYKKIWPSISEQGSSPGKGMKSGCELYVYETSCGVLSILNCIDYAVFSHYIIMHARKPVEIFINPCYDENISRFHDQCNIDCKNNNISIIRINRAENQEGEYGDSCLISKEHSSVIKDLQAEEYRDASDEKYLLFKAKGEEMIIFDLDLDKIPPVDIPLVYKRRIWIIKKYQFDQKWLEI